MVDFIPDRRRMKSLIPRLVPVAVLVLAAVLAPAGCSTLPSDISMPWSHDDEPKTPDRILAIWTDTVRMRAGESGVRGFGGRLFFYQDGEQHPIEVKGGATVYVFDAEYSDPDHPAAEKKYIWSSEEFERHMSESPLGKSYSLWIPWDVVGGEQRSLSIVTRFESDNGAVVISQPVVKLLPGRISSTPADPESGVRQAGFVEEDLHGPGSKPRRQTETIDLPPSFYRHLQTDHDQDRSLETEQRHEVNPGTADFNVEVVQERSTVSVEAAREFDVEQQRARWEERRPTRSQFRRFPAQTTIESQDGPRLPRRSPHLGGWLDGLPPTPRSAARLLPPESDSNASQPAVLADAPASGRP
jgi:hypothetical protein